MTDSNPHLQEFFVLLSQLTVVDNQLRSQAEQHYQTLLKDQGDQAILGLLAVLCSVQIENHIRQLAAVLLRRCLIDDEESIYFRLAVARYVRSSISSCVVFIVYSVFYC
jgi:hypothetical protein